MMNGTMVMCVDVATAAVKISPAVSIRWALFGRCSDSTGWYAAMKSTRCVDAATALWERTIQSTT
jgi:hypothetical protein